MHVQIVILGYLFSITMFVGIKMMDCLNALQLIPHKICWNYVMKLQSYKECLMDSSWLIYNSARMRGHRMYSATPSDKANIRKLINYRKIKVHTVITGIPGIQKGTHVWCFLRLSFLYQILCSQDIRTKFS